MTNRKTNLPPNFVVTARTLELAKLVQDHLCAEDGLTLGARFCRIYGDVPVIRFTSDDVSAFSLIQIHLFEDMINHGYMDLVLEQRKRLNARTRVDEDVPVPKLSELPGLTQREKDFAETIVRLTEDITRLRRDLQIKEEENKKLEYSVRGQASLIESGKASYKELDTRYQQERKRCSELMSRVASTDEVKYRKQLADMRKRVVEQRKRLTFLENAMNKKV